MKTKIFKVTYTKRIGGENTIIVKAINETNAIANAANSCYTGSDFRNPIEINESKYTTPRQQGFQGSERAN